MRRTPFDIQFMVFVLCVPLYWQGSFRGERVENYYDMATNHIGHDHIGHRRNRPQTTSATAYTISATM